MVAAGCEMLRTDAWCCIIVYGSCGCISLVQTLMDRLRQKALAEELRASLRALPEPQFSYDMELPEVRLRGWF